jgi:hypothetical protein
MMSLNGLDAARAIVDLASDDKSTVHGGARALLEAVKPRVVDGDQHWHLDALVAGVRAPFYIPAGRLAEAWECTHAEVLAALREDVEAQAVPADLGELETVWNQPPPPTPHKEL